MRRTSAFFLLQKLPLATPPASRLDKLWPQRPFAYSSAINPTLASAMVNLRAMRVETISTPVLLDITCGSGTLLAQALDRGWSVLGWAQNRHCVDGASENLSHAFGASDTRLVELHDSSRPCYDLGHVACVASNLPWGLDTVKCMEENARILKDLRAGLRTAVLCVFVSKQELDNLESLGYRLLEQASVPPKGYELPRTRKGVKANNKQGRSDCVVTLAETV